MTIWKRDHDNLSYNRALASDISKVLAGHPFTPVESLLPPNPRYTRQRSIDEIEMTLLGWARDGKK